MREFEGLNGIEAVTRARVDMATWYRGTAVMDLCSSLEAATLAPGVREAFALLRQHEITTAIVSVTWEFAVGWFAERFGVDNFVGTKLLRNGKIDHFWPDDKARWIADLAERLGLTFDQIAAVGDSMGDVPMLSLVGHAYFVGAAKPGELDGVMHFPDGDLSVIAREIVQFQHEAANSRSCPVGK